MTQEPQEPYLSVLEAIDRLAAAGLRVKKETLQRWCRLGKVPAVKLPGGHFRIRQADADAILTSPPEGGATMAADVDEPDDVFPRLPDAVASHAEYDYDGEEPIG